MSDAPVRVLGIAGSLRARSYNRALLRTATTLAPPGMTIVIADCVGDLPLYSADLLPESIPAVVWLKEEVARADAVLFAVPEYNAGIAAPLKNALDWISRPRDTTPLRHKPVGMFGASQGPGGTIRAQSAMRESLYYLRAYIQPPPELLIAHVQDKVDADGHLHDERTREQLRLHLHALADWARRWGVGGG